MLKRQKQSHDSGKGEETQHEKDPVLRNNNKANYIDLFKQFQLDRGYPVDKLAWLACPVFKLHPEEYNCKVSSCQGWGFKNYKDVNEHIERAHKPLESDQSPGKNQVPKIKNLKAYQYWDQELRCKSRTGTKSTPEYLRQKWWNTAKALELVEVLPNPLPEDEHFAFPGPELNTLHLLEKWLSQHGLSLIGESDVASMAAANPHPLMSTVAENDVDEIVLQRRMTAAEKLNDRPKAEQVDYVAPPGDSGYYSQGINDRTEEEAAHLSEAYQGNLFGPYSVDNDLRGTGSELSSFDLNLPPLVTGEERWDWALEVDGDDGEQDLSFLP